MSLGPKQPLVTFRGVVTAILIGYVIATVLSIFVISSE